MAQRRCSRDMEPSRLSEPVPIALGIPVRARAGRQVDQGLGLVGVAEMGHTGLGDEQHWRPGAQNTAANLKGCGELTHDDRKPR